MRTILFIIQKEFIQIFRNRTMLPIIFVVPIVQLIILVNAATMEMKNIRLFIVDNDMSVMSRQAISKFQGSPFFVIKAASFSVTEAEQSLKKGETDMVLHIPRNFEKDLIRNDKVKIQILINAINGTVAGISSYYASSILSGLNRDIIAEWYGIPKGSNMARQINITSSYWYNPELNYKNFMVPAVLVLLVTIIGMFLSSMNLVREKEIGTIEQINVTPIKKYQFIAGKLIPFWIIALFELAFGMTVGKLLFHIPMVGSIWLVFFIASIYLIVVLSIGLFNSTITNTQQQAMFISFFMLIIFIMMSGVFTSVENMPAWAQVLNHINPVYYFMKAIRMILLKGSTFTNVLNEIVSISIYAVVMLSLAVRRYRKVT
jgi:ABC-2 type transport system permease protein